MSKRKQKRKQGKSVEGRLCVLSLHIDGFRSWLQRTGYQPTTMVEVVRLLACWADWLQSSGFTLDNIVAGFDASAAVFKGSKTIRGPRGAGALFIRYLREQGALPPPLVPPSPTKIWPILGAFRTWMRGQRGVTDSTLDTYQTSLVDLLKILGDDPKAFTAQAVQAFVLERAKPHSRGRAKTIATSTRAFLRYLVATGQCPTGRDYAVPRFANWQLASVPRFLVAEDIERVIAACEGTQPTGDDPSQILVRQIIGAFDEHTSREISKNTTRAMRESAKQGFWNGATPPLGYKIVEAEHRGQKIKKKLAIDPVEAETVRLMYKLYLEGDGTTGPLGVKETTKWLNSHGYRTRRGSTFGVGPVHKILTNTCYASGDWPYGKRNSRDGGQHDLSNVIYIPVPVLIEQADFDRVAAKLARSNPKTTPPRVVNGPSLLTGLAVCASCGSGMTRTGTTNRQGRSYSYYSCAGCQQKGKTVCKGRHIPAATLDEIVLTNLKHHVLAPDRIADLLKSLVERQAAKSQSVDRRLLTLQREVSDAEDRLKRLYRSIEDGIVESTTSCANAPPP
jgi:hypothetical protein